MANSSISKRQKLYCREETVGADRISDLPDCLLIHILSFLRTKQAIQTSGLSSRWKLLWTYVPKLNLDIDSFSKFECDKVGSIINFECYVSQVLAKHKAKYLRNFRLKYKLYHQKRLDRWISTFTTSALNLQELDLQIVNFPTPTPNTPTPTDRFWKLPHSIFYCNKLVVLKIEGHIVLDPSSSSSFQLNTLKILRLESITFSNRDSFVTLLSFCPVLEDLTLIIYDYKEFNFKICVPTLKRLSVSYLNNELKIDTPSLEYFDFEVMSSLFLFCSNHCYKLLYMLLCLKSLFLQCKRSYGSICPTRFQNLVCLVFKYNGHNLNVLKALLLLAPNLRVVLVDKVSLVNQRIFYLFIYFSLNLNYLSVVIRSTITICRVIIRLIQVVHRNYTGPCHQKILILFYHTLQHFTLEDIKD